MYVFSLCCAKKFWFQHFHADVYQLWRHNPRRILFVITCVDHLSYSISFHGLVYHFPRQSATRIGLSGRVLMSYVYNTKMYAIYQQFFKFEPLKLGHEWVITFHYFTLMQIFIHANPDMFYMCVSDLVESNLDNREKVIMCQWLCVS